MVLGGGVVGRGNKVGGSESLVPFTVRSDFDSSPQVCSLLVDSVVSGAGLLGDAIT